MFSLARSASIVLREHPLRRLEVKTHTLEGKSHHRCISKVLRQLTARPIERPGCGSPYKAFGRHQTSRRNGAMPIEHASQLGTATTPFPSERWLVWSGHFPGFPLCMTNPHLSGQK
jgi:hypothetical protein